MDRWLQKRFKGRTRPEHFQNAMRLRSYSLRRRWRMAYRWIYDIELGGPTTTVRDLAD